MKNLLKKLSVLCVAAMFLLLCSCSPIEKGNSTSDLTSQTEEKQKYENIEIPEISSEDTVMPTYFDISLYNVENYSEIYLGKDFKFKITYGGNSLEVPSTYKKMISKGFKLVDSEEYDEESVILAGKTMKAQFVNEYNNIIDAVFYNASNSSVELKDCRIVRFNIAENNTIAKKSKYGQFFVNGVTNQSAITDVIEYLGAPSHFYAINDHEYYLDYFVSKDDLRSRITVYINPKEDSVKSIEFANYN
ncbi:MAG: hypothetical protein MJ090_00155 [Clostridia bacterium]|nr:hypothetical protein [Clostridia bacterium]